MSNQYLMLFNFYQRAFHSTNQQIDQLNQQINLSTQQVYRLQNTLDEIRQSMDILSQHIINPTPFPSTQMRRPATTTQQTSIPTPTHQRNTVPQQQQGVLDNLVSNIFSNAFGRITQQTNVGYDYNNPISPLIYTFTLGQDGHIGNEQLNNILSAFLNTRVPVRPTAQQIDNASRVVVFSQIENPLNNTCPISLEAFAANQNVRQIRHCGHIFNETSFQEWFQNNVQCPVCRYDIRNYPTTQSISSMPTPQVQTSRPLEQSAPQQTQQTQGGNDDILDQTISELQLPSHRPSGMTSLEHDVRIPAAPTNTATTTPSRIQPTQSTINIASTLTQMLENIMHDPSNNALGRLLEEAMFDPSENTFSFVFEERR